MTTVSITSTVRFGVFYISMAQLSINSIIVEASCNVSLPC